jgi:hypothetical protein
MTHREDKIATALGALSPTLDSNDMMSRIEADAALEQAFATARRDAPQPSDLLLARITRDAMAHRPARWFDAAVWGGLVAAGITGLMIGMGAITVPTTLAAAEANYALTPSYDFQLLAEE